MAKREKNRIKNLKTQDEYIYKLISATVRVECRKPGGKSSIGTGFIVGNGNYAVTAFHVVDGADEVKIIQYHAVKGTEEINAANYPRIIEVDSWTKGAYLIGQKKDATEPVMTDGSISGRNSDQRN
jgi:S1-C subfamily serine protease